MELKTEQELKRDAPGLLKDEVRFLKSWAKSPLLTGAVAPSGLALARAMAHHAGLQDNNPVIELGPGTGMVTKALLARGIAPERIVAIEYNPKFCQLLKSRFPAITILQGDAYALEKTLAARGFSRPSIVISSLPLLTQPLARRSALIARALELMPKGAAFIQFSYGFSPPVKAEELPMPCLVTKSPWILRNLPPARVWRYSLPTG